MNSLDRQRRSMLIFVMMVGVILVIAILAIGFGSGAKEAETTTALNSGTFPAPLSNVDFPTTPVAYPTGWLEELMFPNELILVDYSSGVLPENSSPGWAAKFRYQGSPSEAVELVSSFLEEKGWTIFENNKLELGGYALLIQRGQGNGIIVMDSDPSNASHTLIVATIFP